MSLSCSIDFRWGQLLGPVLIPVIRVTLRACRNPYSQAPQQSYLSGVGNLYFYVSVNFKCKLVVLSLKKKDTHMGKM